MVQVRAPTGCSIHLRSIVLPMTITVMGVLPVMIVYPFLQKYFVKGISIGAVKG